MLREDVFGTIAMTLFDLFVIMLIIVLCTKPLTPIWVSVLIGAIFSGIGVWGTYKVAKYWIDFFKRKFKKEDNE